MLNESWVEKFRPKSLDQVISQEEIISSLKDVIKTQNVPHLLFFGPSGCGKTSTILALSRELFGDKYWEDRVIELNASDERGIKVVREKIKMYAKSAINMNSNIPPWKIIILDEADNMTSDSQFALRKIMEDYSKVTRFCIICNYHHKIIDPIVSRCSMFRFRPIPLEEIRNKLISICKEENIYCSDNNIENIINICNGDLRKAVNLLQKCKRNLNFISTKKKLQQIDIINEELINEISGIIPKQDLDNFLKACIEENIEQVDENIKKFYINAYSLTNQIESITKLIINSNLTNIQKTNIIQKLVQIDQNLIKGCDEYIQFFRLGYYIMTTVKKN
jgi:replication factor C subunit 2/4